MSPSFFPVILRLVLISVGCSLGSSLGSSVGASLGSSVGSSVGFSVGSSEGSSGSSNSDCLSSDSSLIRVSSEQSLSGFEELGDDDDSVGSDSANWELLE